MTARKKAKASMGGLTHGANISRLTVGNLPAKMRKLMIGTRAYRRALEAAVVESRGEVSLVDAHRIDEAAGCEMHAAICRWLLRERLDKMSVSDVTRCSEAIAKSKALRNKAVTALKIDKDRQADIIATLYSIDEKQA